MDPDTPPTPASGERPLITAFEVSDATGWEITPAPYQRQCMDDTPGRGAYRCLPLTMANQAGWFVHSPYAFEAVWTGEVADSAISFTFDDAPERSAQSVLSHFGTGIVTFRLPFMFRTPPGIGLLVRGAPNWPVVNFSPLEGLVETDWNPASFTMNWKILEPGKVARFQKEWPVCFLQPFDLSLPERLVAERKKLKCDSDEAEDYLAWRESRAAFMNSPEKAGGGWQRDYFQGLDSKGIPVASHKTNFRISPFRNIDAG
jgi:hypothetical protein